MRKIAALFIMGTLLLAGCKDKNVILNYEGKSKNWEVTYKIDGNEKSHESYYVFKYIGDYKDELTEIRYIIDGPKEGEDGIFTLNDANEYSGKMIITGGLPSNSDRDIDVKLEWNSDTETMVLTREN